MSCLLAIDQSTSATKALLFDVVGSVIDSEALNHQQHYPQPGWVEHDCEEIWNNLRQVVRTVCDRNPDRAGQLQGVSITNQRETVVVFDRETGTPLTRAIGWQCRRSDAICQEFLAAGHQAMVQEKTGLKLDAYFSASKLTWLVRQQPDLHECLANGNALVATMDAYLIYRLTVGRVFATDHTNASRTLLFDIANLRWDDELCELFHVPRAALPEVRESFAQFGETDLAGTLSTAVPICGVMGDSQASLLAQRCYEPGETKATFGSGTSVLLNIGDVLQMPQNGAVAALAWVHNGQPTYAWEGLINYSAATIAWLKDQLGLIESVADSEGLAATVDDSGGVYLLPAFAGLSAPYWRSDVRAAIVGMTAYTRKEHIVRAALESIAYQVHDVLVMMSESGVIPRTVNADGGPTRNRLLMQLVADLSRLEVTTSETPESSALGAAMAGLVGLGVVASIDDLRKLPRTVQTFHPAMSEQCAQRLTAGWNAAVQRLLSP